MRPAPALSIVHVSSRYPPVLGGLEQVAKALAYHQQQSGISVQVITSDHGVTEEFSEPGELQVTRLKSFDIANTIIIPGLLRALGRLDRGTLVHVHISSAFVPEMVWINARLKKTPYVAHVHLDVLPSGWAGVLLKPYKRLILSRVLRDAVQVLVPTLDYVALIAAKYNIPQDRIQVIRNGMDHEIAEQPRSIVPTSGRTPHVLLVGRLVPQKNIPLAVAAIASYVARFDRHIHLDIVGDGRDRESINRLVDQLGLADVITLHGAVFSEHLEKAYRQSDVLIMTSVNESFGIVLVEAMAKGLPIVSVDIAGARNVVEDGINGILCCESPDALAHAIHDIVTRPAVYSSMSAANIARASHFTWTSIVTDLTAIYRSLLAVILSSVQTQIDVSVNETTSTNGKAAH
jgi:glycosyltransferase involved in cell wall biosynthesis